MNRKTISLLFTICLLLSVILPSLTSCNKPAAAAEVTFNGYIMDEHCFIKKPVPSSDSKTCLQMPACAATGYGIAVLQDDKKYKFYYFDGDFSPAATGAQVMATDLVNKTTKSDHIYITVLATLTGDSKKAADDTSYPILKVISMVEAQD